MKDDGLRRATRIGALLSGLILPGLGQLYQGKLGRGIALMAATLLCLTVLVVKMVSAIAASLNVGTRGGVSPSKILATISAAYETLGSVGAWLLVAILCLWIISVADALWGRGMTEVGVKRDCEQGPR